MVVVAKEDHQQEENKGKRKYMEIKNNNEFNSNLSLGSLTFEEIYEGRFKCIETGHEMLSKDIEFYKQSKPYKLALIDVAMSQEQKQFPFSIFKFDPNCKTKLICMITGDCVNKSEQHILKHINGIKFLLCFGKKINEESMNIEEPKQVSPNKINGESMKIKEPKQVSPYKKGSYRFKKIRVRERRKHLKKKRQKVYGTGNPDINKDRED